MVLRARGRHRIDSLGGGGLYWEVKPREAKVFFQIFDTEKMKFRWKNPNWRFEYLNTAKECSLQLKIIYVYRTFL